MTREKMIERIRPEITDDYLEALTKHLTAIYPDAKFKRLCRPTMDGVEFRYEYSEYLEDELYFFDLNHLQTKQNE